MSGFGCSGRKAAILAEDTRQRFNKRVNLITYSTINADRVAVTGRLRRQCGGIVKLRRDNNGIVLEQIARLSRWFATRHDDVNTRVDDIIDMVNAIIIKLDIQFGHDLRRYRINNASLQPRAVGVDCLWPQLPCECLCHVAATGIHRAKEQHAEG